MAPQSDRLALLIRMLDPEDYQYIRAYDFRLEARFRRDRMRIYRAELRTIAADALESYQARLSNLNAAGAWIRYPSLVLSTANSFFSIGKLCVAGALFRFRIPVLVNLRKPQERLQRFLTIEGSSAEPHRLPA